MGARRCNDLIKRVATHTLPSRFFRSYTFTNLDTSHGVPLNSLKGRPVVFSAWVYITGTDNSTPTINRSLLITDRRANVPPGLHS